jgi:hypothetical protein
MPSASLSGSFNVKFNQTSLRAQANVADIRRVNLAGVQKVVDDVTGLEHLSWLPTIHRAVE